ncbi:hypothetical protein A3K72_01275 [Candidatus Woesearchaeota archaeon RBG_13_36_6]|nr:MAG: hypothetical protein A3K72_01275 [Candidatus Woesearchaeota archaeon RBG_13_36_6]
MKKELTGLELHYLIQELNLLLGSKVDKVYHPNKRELIINFYLSGKGKEILRVLVPNFIYITEHKQEYPQTPSGFCVLLRKHLENTRLKEINQLGFERIIEFVFEHKQGKRILIFELFSKGNIVLCKEDYTIIATLEVQRWSKRTVKLGVRYEYPKKEFNFLRLKEEEFAKLMKESKKNLVKTLAIDLGLGGVYAEELCLMARVDKNKKDVDNSEIKSLIKASEKLRSKKTNASIVYEGQGVVDVVPIELEFYKELKKREFKTYNDALDASLTKVLVKAEKEQRLSRHQKQIEKLNRIVEKQEQHVTKLEKDIEENTEKAELIYKNYKLVDNVLTELRKARERLSWEEIKQRLKGHKVVKDIKEKEKAIVIELK